eukprot:NODE_10268_length_601_cov_61.207113_g9994_i0.p1 GENE.NODE_10268_length_601_cov_61.207113_g9994_i0~~NODE_10268_length_601_cov_61.207113_g9994_i0.p1  ORF type:complete len:171 (-),score=43.24 NODE_10268_length_601_cov_61.207113_g9994_i0:88-543(-)
MPFVDIKQYAWDQSAKFCSIYISLDGISEQSKVDVDFDATAVFVKCYDINGADYRFGVVNLCEEIAVKESKFILKPGRLVVKLKKKQEGVEWSGLDDTEKKKKQQHKQLAESGATTEQLLANMYAQADDKTREDLAKAAAEGQAKREARGK